MAQAIEHFEIQWVSPAKWKTSGLESIELASRTPAMLKHVLLEQRDQINWNIFQERTRQRQEAIKETGGQGRDLSLAQAVSADVDYPE